MLVVGRLDEAGPSALKGYLVTYSLGVAQGWYHAGPSALMSLHNQPTLKWMRRSVSHSLSGNIYFP